jgi:hypothetical protein
MAQGGGGLGYTSSKYVRSDIQEQSIRDAEINPDLLLPEGISPRVMEDWPPPGEPVFLPESKVPEQMKK